jgi:hypothetical protein
MVVVPAMSTNATTDIAKVSFTVLPHGDCKRKRAIQLVVSRTSD